MLSHTWKSKNPSITKPALGNLKPVSTIDAGGDSSDSVSIKLAYLENLATGQVEEICELRRQLLEEKSKNLELEQKIQEMKDFLDDYGLHWVGGPRPQTANGVQFMNGPDHNLFLQKIDELNNIAEPKKVEFVQNGNISTVKHQKPISIVLHDKGFTLDGGEMRYYDKQSNQLFLRDILDGFFPQEFKENYPDGIKIRVDDKRSPTIIRPSTNYNSKHGNNAKMRPNSSDLELLPPPTNIGSGDGAVKVRVPALSDVVIRISREMIVAELLALIEENFDIHQIKLTSPLSADAFDEDAKLSDVGLYPRGYAIVVYK